MTVNETPESYIITSNMKEYHYPKAVWTEQAAKEDLERYFKSIDAFESARRKK